MADKTFFGRLQTLFSTGTVVRRTDSGLKVSDLSKVQANTKLATNRLIDRYNRIYQANTHGYNQQANFHTMRLQLYTDYEIMDEDSIISSALDIYADESTLKNEYGNIIEIKTDNEKVQKVLNNLFYDVLNIEFNAWPWLRNMCKYGDFYLKLDITEKVGITNAVPLSSYEMFREEGVDPENPEVVNFTHDPTMGGAQGYGKTANNQMKYENYEVAHFRLLNDMNFLPYGKSIIEPARKTWKQLTLMEDAMLIHRIMRAPEKRVYKIDIGNIPPNEVEAYMQRVIQNMKKTPYIDEKTGQYNLKFNMSNMLEDVYLPVRGGQSGTEIDTLSGMSFDGIDDVNYLKERMFAALKVPKAFLGYEEGVDGKATLAAQDVRFSRTIERLQRIFISELTKVAMVHLYSQGFENEEMVEFELSMTNPSNIAEQEKLELWSTKISLADSIKSNQMMSEEWIYKNVYNMTSEQIDSEKLSLIEDLKQTFRKTQIEQEGNDPMETGEALGTPHTLATLDPENTDGANTSLFGNIGNEPGQGRPEEPTSFDSQESARGRDSVGKEERKRDTKLSNNKSLRRFEGRNVRNMFKKAEQNKTSLLNESNIIEEDI